MFIEPEPSIDVADRIRSKLESVGLTASSTGSKVRTIVDVFLSERADALRDIRFIASRAFLSTASGGYLDLIGRDLFGISRLGSTAASVTEIDGNILLYTNTGVLADFLPNDLGGSYVPTGVELTDRTDSIVYVTDKKLYVENAATQVFISAAAISSGGTNNMPAGALIAVSINGVSVRNLSPITNGSDPESDDNYRFRISLGYVSAEKNNITAIRLAALSVPGVSNVLVRNIAYGPGTAQVLVIPEGNSVSQSVLNRVQENVNAVKPREMNVFVDAPDYISISIAYAFFGRILTPEERGLLTRTIQANAASLVASTGGGATFDPNSAILPSLSVVPGIVGRVEKLCVNGVPQPSKIYKLDIDEILILDITEQEPIRVYA